MDDTDDIDRAIRHGQYHTLRAVEDRFGPEDMEEWRAHSAE